VSVRDSVQGLTVDVYAFDPIPIPGVSERLNTVGGWVTGLVYFACIIALLIGGAYIGWDRISDHGGGKGVKIAGGTVIGAIVIASATGIIDALR